MRNFWMAATIILGGCLALIAGLWIGAAYHQQIASTVGNVGARPTENPSKERKVLYWTDPMYNPPYISDKPGKSPMGMDLIPVYEDEASGNQANSAGGQTLTIDPVVIQNMGMRVAKVSQGSLRTTLRLVGTLAEPEQNRVEINLRVSGWIQKLYANQEGMAVQKGDKLFDLYSLDLTAAADELINARKAADAVSAEADVAASTLPKTIFSAAKRKLELLGLTADDVDAISKMDNAPATVTFTSPLTGHVVEKTVVEGSSVKAGDRVMRLVDRSSMWLQVQVYEYQLPLVPVGTTIRAQVNGVPGKTYEGKVEFIYPLLDTQTRTATARITLMNPDHELREGMYATALINAEVASNALRVPREAVIDSGTRQIVFIAQEGGHFAPRTVTVGPSGQGDDADGGDEMVQILTGLSGGETVVTSGQFLLDSESRMTEAIQKHLRDRLVATGAAAGTPAKATTATAPVALAPATASTDQRVDPVVKAYLNLAKALVGADKPVDPSAFIDAAGELAGVQSQSKLRELAMAMGGDGAALAGLPIDKQREAFKKLSTDVISLVDLFPPSTGVAAAIYVFHCPMANADWLQTTEETANPYLQDMTTCGTVTRKILLRPGGGEKQP